MSLFLMLCDDLYGHDTTAAMTRTCLLIGSVEGQTGTGEGRGGAGCRTRPAASSTRGFARSSSTRSSVARSRSFNAAPEVAVSLAEHGWAVVWAVALLGCRSPNTHDAPHAAAATVAHRVAESALTTVTLTPQAVSRLGSQTAEAAPPRVPASRRPRGESHPLPTLMLPAKRQ